MTTFSNRDAEVTVLAASFASQVTRHRVRAILTARDFEQPHHEAIWNAFTRIDASGEAVTGATVIEAIKADRAAVALLPELARPYGSDEATAAAKIVRDLSTRRSARTLLVQAMQRIESPNITPGGFLSTLINDATDIRDAGSADEDLVALTLRELLDQPDEPYNWLIPGLLERGDRLMLTGVEGQGKSVLLRQLAVAYAGGLHPFKMRPLPPGNVLIVDAENTERQVRRSMRGLATAVASRSTRDPRDHVIVECTGRIDITDDMVLSRIHRIIDAQQPDIVVIGPLYRITRGALQNDDDAAPVLAALDTIKDRGICLLIEAHAGHSQKSMGVRDLRPRGSSSLLGWPEFGYGLKPGDSEGEFRMERWRGDRDVRDWPSTLERGGRLPWMPGEAEAIEWATTGSPWERAS